MIRPADAEVPFTIAPPASRGAARARALLAVGIALCLLSGTGSAGSGSRAAHADSLFRHARALLELNTIDTRRVAIHELEEAVRLAPSNAEYARVLATTYLKAGFLKQGREMFEHVRGIDPDDAGAHAGLGEVARRDWLKYLDRASLIVAIEHFDRATQLEPDLAAAWIGLAPLLIERGDLEAALRAAEGACRTAPDRPEPLLARGEAAYLLGNLELANGAFVAALARLPRRSRELFEDISPIATMRDTMILHHLPVELQADFLRRFWKNNDPDVATELNEAQLEFWARGAQAYLLFFDPRIQSWDERGEVYVRYGRPAQAVYNPLGIPLVQLPTGPQALSPSRMGAMPINVQLWFYPQLGMNVLLHDYSLSESYRLPITKDFDPDPQPNPLLLAAQEGTLAVSGGRGVFPKLPPGVRPLPLTGVVARFEGDQRNRLLAQIESPGAPGESLRAEWVVLDSVRREVARGSRTLSPSACAPTERQVADFAAELPAGPYLVGMTVSDGEGRRGIFRQETVVTRAAAERLNLSDVVVTCGTPRVGSERVVRIEPNPSAQVESGQALTAYVEMYHLQTDERGQSRFEMSYTVKSAVRDERIWLQRLFAPRQVPPPIVASREETQPGSLRRQFVTVPMEALPSGRYRLEIRVKDLIRDQEAVGHAEFVRTLW